MSLMRAADLNKRVLVEGGAYYALKLCKNITINNKNNKKTIKTGIQQQLETASAAQNYVVSLNLGGEIIQTLKLNSAKLFW